MKKIIRRICFYGGPGSGKSTTAARVFSELKERQYSVEHCHEYVKRWVYMDRKVGSSIDQVYIFAKQQQLEYTCLNDGVSHIVTDSPCFLSYFYALKYFGETQIPSALLKIIQEYDKTYPAMHIFLKRGEKSYDPKGRWQSHEESLEIDQEIFHVLNLHYTVHQCDYQDKQGILDLVTTNLLKSQSPF